MQKTAMSVFTTRYTKVYRYTKFWLSVHYVQWEVMGVWDMEEPYAWMDLSDIHK
jgi:hypothetical protein